MGTRFFLTNAILILFCLFTAIPGWSYDPFERDTLWFGEWTVHVSGPPYTGEAIVPVIVFNDEPVQGLSMPFKWAGPMSIDTLYLAEGRPDVFDDVEIGIDTSISNLAWIMAVSTGEAMPPGTGPIAYLHFTVYDTGWAVVDTAVSSTVLWLYFVDIQSHYWTPEVTPTPSEYHIQHYCEVGDVNCDGIINVGDVVFLVNYLYRSGPPPDTPGRGDVNGDGDVNVGDVIYLTNFLYRSGPAPRG